jgi:hypothetical protein
MLNWKRHVLRVFDPPGTVYAIAARETREGEKPTVFDFAPVRADGRLEFRLPFDDIQFTRTATDLEIGKANNSPRAMLIRFTGRLDARSPRYVVTLPSTERSRAVR